MNDRSIARLSRFAPLAGAAYAVLVVAADLTIGKFPDSNTSTTELTSYYAAHHAQVAAGGLILAWAAIVLAVFGCVLWSRARTTPAVAAAVLVGTAVAVVGELDDASTFWHLGHISTQAATTPAALQALHIAGAEGGFGGGVTILLLGVAVAGLLANAVPRWLAWPAVVLGVLQLTPTIGFFASLLFLLWACVTGVVLTVRPVRVHGMRTAEAVG
jgi:hypothetical protein